VKALVTGGAGFIGSNLVDALHAAGRDVTVIDDLSTGHHANLETALSRGVTLHEIDIRDAAAVRAFIAVERPCVVFHLAAQIDVRQSVADCAWDARINVEGTINVLDAAHAAGVERFVLASTGGAIYGDTARIPSGEETPVQPLAPYGQSKHAAEGYCGLYTRLHRLSTVCLRYANVYGPRQDPLGEGGVVAIFCGKLLEDKPPTIYGDGTQTRDYVFVDDVVAATMSAADSRANGCFNVGTGNETTVLGLVEALRELEPGLPLEPVHAPARQGELDRSCLDPGRASRELGWNASFDLPRGLRRTLDWLQAGR